MKQVAFAELRDHPPKYLATASEEQIVITKHGEPAGVLTGFANDDDWFDFRLENDPRFLKKIGESGAVAGGQVGGASRRCALTTPHRHPRQFGG